MLKARERLKNIAVLSDETAWLRWPLVHPDSDEWPVWVQAVQKRDTPFPSLAS
jgi:hypothetical protein